MRLARFALNLALISLLALAWVLVCAPTFLGCAHVDHLQLDARWRPLTRIQENALTPEGVFQTVSPLLLTHSLSDFTSADAVSQEGLLRHEQLHALRQEACPSGKAWWLALYAVDPAFRWEEERLGWDLQLRYVVEHGGQVDVPLVAGILSGPTYGVAGVPMLSYDRALAWVNATVSR